MSSQYVLGGLNRTLAEKQSKKFDKELESRLRRWLADLIQNDRGGAEFAARLTDESLKFHEVFRTGEILCLVVNHFVPGAVKKINPAASQAFKHIENIDNFLKAAPQLGLAPSDVFRTIDLTESKDLVAVLNCLNRLQQLYEKHGDGLAEAAKEQGRPKAAISTVPMPAMAPVVVPPKSSPQPAAAQPSMMGPSVPSLADDVAAKEQFKYDPLLERQARAWIEAVLDEQLPPNESLAQVLKSGVILCRLINEIRPGSVAVINYKNIPYLQMENIQNYLRACGMLGVRASDLFNTVDLFEEKNMNQVVANLHVLGKHVRKLDGYAGPVIEDSSKARNLFAASLMNNLDALDDSPGVPYEELSPDRRQLVDWVNAQLGSYDFVGSQFADDDMPRSINNLKGDVRNGVVLLELLEAVAKQPAMGALFRKPTTLSECMQNATQFLRQLSAHTFELVDSCTAYDIVVGDEERIARLLQFMRDKYDLDLMYLRLVHGDGVIVEYVDEEVEEEEEETPLEPEEPVRKSVPLLAPTPPMPRARAASISVPPSRPSPHIETTSPANTPPRQRASITPAAAVTGTIRAPSPMAGFKFTVPLPKRIAERTDSPDASPTKTEAKAEVRPEVKETKEVKVDVKVEPKPMIAAEPAPIKTLPVAVKTETVMVKTAEPAKVESKIEVNVESKVASKGESKAEPKAEPKAESKADANVKPEVKQEAPSVKSMVQNLGGASPPRPDRAFPISRSAGILRRPDPQAELMPPPAAASAPVDPIPPPVAASVVEPAKPVVVSAVVEPAKSASASDEPVRASPKLLSKRVVEVEVPTATTTVVEPVSAPAIPPTVTIHVTAEVGSTRDEPQQETTTTSTSSSTSSLASVTSQSQSQKLDAPQKLSRPRRLSDAIKEKIKKTHIVKGKIKVVLPTPLPTPSPQSTVAATPQGPVDEAAMEERKRAAQAVMRRRIADEMLTTERNYLSSIRLITDHFVGPLAANGVLSKDEIFSMVANLDELVSLHTEFLGHLETRMAAWSDDASLHDIFIERTAFLREYQPYMVGYGASLLYLAYFNRKYPGVTEGIKNFNLMQKKTTRLTIENLLIMPVQRIPRYVLLLKEFKKYSPAHATELTAAMDKVEAMLKELNGQIKKMALEDARKLQNIMESVEGDIESYVTPTSVFVLQAALNCRKCVEPKGGSVQLGGLRAHSDATCFLLNGAMLVCRHVPDSNDRLPYRLLAVLPTSEIRGAILKPQSTSKLSFVVQLTGDGAVQFKCKTPEEARNWINEIERLVRA